MTNAGCGGIVPRGPGRRIVAGRENRFSAAATEIFVKAIGAIMLLALGGTAAVAQAGEKAPGADRPLLATFCDAADIKGSACRRAKGYRSGKRCDVKLTPDRIAANSSPTAARF